MVRDTLLLLVVVYTNVDTTTLSFYHFVKLQQYAAPMIAFRPIESARTNRVWRGELPMDSLDRLSKALDGATGMITVELEFSYDENRRIKVTGTATTNSIVTCFRCLQATTIKIYAPVDYRLVQSEHEAKEIFSIHDAIVFNDEPITLQELIEDDLLLSIPPLVCDSTKSCRANVATGGDQPTTKVHRPFANLAKFLKTSQ